MATHTPAGRRRVAVTGAGVVAACGIGKDAFWEGLLSPAPEGLRRVHDWDPTPHFANAKEIRRADRFEQFAVGAAAEALAQSGKPTGDPVRHGGILGTGIGGLYTIEEQTPAGCRRSSSRWSWATLPPPPCRCATACRGRARPW
jgi:3-oxoacyl-[acyl-carrier-protein] synthase II